MDVYDAIRTRLTVRQYKADPVPEDVIMKLLRAAQWAPSSRNLQPWHFVVIKDRDTLREIGGIASSGGFIADAPMAIAIAMEDDADRPELDAGRTLQQIELVAWEEGLGTCFVGLRVEEQNRKVKEILGIPDNLELITVLPFGFRPDNMRGGRRRDRKALGDMAYDGKFGTPYPEG